MSRARASFRATAALVPALALAGGCAPELDPWVAQMEAGDDAIEAERLMEHVSHLASDELEGRAPGTPGGRRTVSYLADAFEEMGLEPGNDGSYTQAVSLVAYTAEPEARFHVGEDTIEASVPDAFVARSRRFEPEIDVSDSELLFVGYGVRAPEYDWDDFGGVDVAGKTLLVLVNDPPVPDPDDPESLDAETFRGEAMTYYGRWTYKYEIAAELGAEAVIVIHQTGPAGYPFDVISGAFSGEGFDVPATDPGKRLAVEAWVGEATARELFAAAGHDFDALQAAAARRGFRPVALDGTAELSVRTTQRQIESHNVVARRPGSDPARRGEHVIYTAHWDHMGTDEEGRVFNGAVDNASGTATLLEIARAFAELDVAPARSTLFLALTAEENGLLGAKWYAENPIFPLESTLAVLNMDSMNPWGPTNDIEVIGYGNSTLEEVLEEEAAEQDRRVRPDASPEVGYFYRSDHFEFARMGVPALYTKGGKEYVDRPEGWGEERWARWTANDYHAVSDTVADDWNLEGLARDARLLFRVGYRVAREPEWPEWYEGTEFRAVRREALDATGGAP